MATTASATVRLYGPSGTAFSISTVPKTGAANIVAIGSIPSTGVASTKIQKGSFRVSAVGFAPIDFEIVGALGVVKLTLSPME